MCVCVRARTRACFYVRAYSKGSLQKSIFNHLVVKLVLFFILYLVYKMCNTNCFSVLARNQGFMF